MRIYTEDGSQTSYETSGIHSFSQMPARVSHKVVWSKNTATNPQMA